MNEITNNNPSDLQLELALVLKEITSNLLQLKMFDGRLLLSPMEVADKLNIDAKKVRQMYKDKNCVIEGIEDGKNIKIYYDSVLKYIEQTKNPKFFHDNYFSNMNNISRDARKVTRTEVERFKKSAI